MVGSRPRKCGPWFACLRFAYRVVFAAGVLVCPLDDAQRRAAAYAENGRFTDATATAGSGLQLANTQRNSALTKIFETDLAHYRADAPVRIALPTK